MALPIQSLITFEDSAAPALKDDESGWLSYGALVERILIGQKQLPDTKTLIFLYCHNDISSVSWLYAGLMGRHAVALFDPNLPPEAKELLEEIYRPDVVINARADQSLTTDLSRSDAVPHADLSLLLSTSGSTGSPKLVRLSNHNVMSNAQAIADVLSIKSQDVAVAHLPLHYSYGLSVLLSHLKVGASVRLTNNSFTNRDFWSLMKDDHVTHLPGVPFHYQMLGKLGYGRFDAPSLRSLTQAGGFLDVENRVKAHAFMQERSGAFYVMYGQTEAAPRMSTLQHKDFMTHPASVGNALPGGRFIIRDPDKDGVGEVVYEGPNVMMGYAERREDLCLGDDLAGKLETGDLGVLNADGILTLRGRAKRMGKVYGLRVNLDEVETFINQIIEGAVIQKGEQLVVTYVAATDTDEEQSKTLRSALTDRYSLPVTAYQFIRIDVLPRTERGKIDYKTLERTF